MQSAYPILSKTKSASFLVVMVLEFGIAVYLSSIWHEGDWDLRRTALTTGALVSFGVLLLTIWILSSVESAFRSQVHDDMDLENKVANSALDVRARVIALERAMGIRPTNNYNENKLDDYAVTGWRYPVKGIDRYAPEWYGNEELWPNLYGESKPERTVGGNESQIERLDAPGNDQAPVETRA